MGGVYSSYQADLIVRIFNSMASAMEKRRTGSSRKRTSPSHSRLEFQYAGPGTFIALAEPYERLAISRC
jgi:hypothetical protein